MVQPRPSTKFQGVGEIIEIENAFAKTFGKTWSTMGWWIFLFWIYILDHQKDSVLQCICPRVNKHIIISFKQKTYDKYLKNSLCNHDDSNVDPTSLFSKTQIAKDGWMAIIKSRWSRCFPTSFGFLIKLF